MRILIYGLLLALLPWAAQAARVQESMTSTAIQQRLQARHHLEVDGVEKKKAEVSVMSRAEQVYAQACSACHTSGVAGAPRKGQASDWSSRQKKGLDALVHSVKHGLGAMPAKGMCYDCSDADYQETIEWMMR